MSLETSIRDMAAKAALQICKLRTPATFSHKGATGITVYCSAGPERYSFEEVNGHTREVTERDFFVPRQTGFPPTNFVSTQDTFTYDGFTYSIRGFAVDSIGASWRCTTIRYQPQDLGGGN